MCLTGKVDIIIIIHSSLSLQRLLDPSLNLHFPQTAGTHHFIKINIHAY